MCFKKYEHWASAFFFGRITSINVEFVTSWASSFAEQSQTKRLISELIDDMMDWEMDTMSGLWLLTTIKKDIDFHNHVIGELINWL